MPAGKITSLHVQAHDPQRINVFIDGAFAIGVSLDTVVREGLHVGQILAQEDFERLEQAEHSDQAIRSALRLIELRPRSVAELRDRLRRKEFRPEAIDHAVERLAQLGLVDDTAFARFWVEQRQRSRPKGPAALRNELRRKGIASETIASVLDDEELTGAPSAQALSVARKVAGRYLSAPDYATFSRRLGGFLQRRGFDFGTIRPVLEQLWAERGEAAAPDDGFDEE